MKIISIVNQKGGVAKTTTAAALADGFARRGKKVLLIDLDPQGNLTTSYRLTDDYNCPQSLLLLGYDRTRHATPRVINHNLSIITSEEGLETANSWLLTQLFREQYLSRALKEIPSEYYDYAIIDTNPSLSIITLNAIMASDYIIIPFKPEFNSFKGIDLLISSVAQIQRTKPELKILGFAATMTDARRSSTRESIAYVSQIAEGIGSKVFKSHIRIAVACADAPSYGKSVYEYAPDSPVTQDYERLCDEVLNKLGEKDNGIG